MLIIDYYSPAYILYNLITLCVVVGLYFLFRKSAMITKRKLVFGLMVLNLSMHFLKFILSPQYRGTTTHTFFLSICAANVFFMPILFLCKNDCWRDYCFYVGVLGGLGALIMPIGILGKSILDLEVINYLFYHSMLVITPMLMVLLGVHKLDYHRCAKVPFMLIMILFFILANDILDAEILGQQSRGGDFFNIGYDNQSLFWQPNNEVGEFLQIFTPKALRTVPFGEYAGQDKYLPMLYMLPIVFIGGWVLSFLLSLPWEGSHVYRDCTSLAKGIKKFIQLHR